MTVKWNEITDRSSLPDIGVTVVAWDGEDYWLCSREFGGEESYTWHWYDEGLNKLTHVMSHWIEIQPPDMGQ